jgi:hypothetical protein
MTVREDDGTKLLTFPKNNNTGEQSSLTYDIATVNVGRDEEDGTPIDAPYVVWTGTSDRTARDIFEERAEKAFGRGGRPRNPDSKSSQAELLVWTLLAGGPKPQKEVEAVVTAAGISTETLKKTKARLKVVSTKTSMDGGWVWSLPTQPADTVGNVARNGYPTQPGEVSGNVTRNGPAESDFGVSLSSPTELPPSEIPGKQLEEGRYTPPKRDISLSEMSAPPKGDITPEEGQNSLGIPSSAKVQETTGKTPKGDGSTPGDEGSPFSLGPKAFSTASFDAAEADAPDTVQGDRTDDTHVSTSTSPVASDDVPTEEAEPLTEPDTGLPVDDPADEEPSAPPGQDSTPDRTGPDPEPADTPTDELDADEDEAVRRRVAEEDRRLREQYAQLASPVAGAPAHEDDDDA